MNPADKRTPVRKHKFSEYFYNSITYAGVLLSSLVFISECALFGIDFITKGANFYLGIITYVFLPPFLILGLILIPLGALRHRRRVLKGIVVSGARPIILDPSVPTHRNAVMVFLFGTTVLLIMTFIGSYKAFHYTESVHFCGVTCHQVMKPEYTTYLNSPHARVKCVDCHIGPGADWYVRSKLSGLRQVYHAAKGDYSRPIKTPVENLRPSKETCEQCHWPAKFFGAQQRMSTRRLADKDNTPWRIDMLIKVGGGDPTLGSSSGIHWHMNIQNEIDYIATDAKRQVIPWVRSTDLDGNVVEYMSTESPLTPEQMAKSEVRRMDCIDCHNRPSHIFQPPDKSLDASFEAGRLDPSLPYLKHQAIELMIKPYADDQEAERSILAGLSEYYQKSHPELMNDKALAIQQATAEVLRIYKSTFFPSMKTDWRTHPNNLGHMNSEGCFRCHDGLHKSKDGKVITKDCNACHTFLGQGPPEEVEKMPATAQPFRHPVDMGMDVTEERCTMCHTGAGGV